MLAVRNEIGRRCQNELEPYFIVALGATRKLLPPQQRDVVRKAVLDVMDSVDAAFLDCLSRLRDERGATGCRSGFAWR